MGCLRKNLHDHSKDTSSPWHHSMSESASLPTRMGDEKDKTLSIKVTKAALSFSQQKMWGGEQTMSTNDDSSMSINWDALDAMLIFDHIENNNILTSIAVECEAYYQLLGKAIDANDTSAIQTLIQRMMTFALQFHLPRLLALTTDLKNQIENPVLISILAELRLLSHDMRKKIKIT